MLSCEQVTRQADTGSIPNAQECQPETSIGVDSALESRRAACHRASSSARSSAVLGELRSFWVGSSVKKRVQPQPRTLSANQVRLSILTPRLALPLVSAVVLQRPLLLIRFERRPLGCPVSWLSTYTLLEEATALNHIPRIVSIRESAASALLSASDPMRRVSRRNRDKTSPQSHTFLKSLLGMQLELSLRFSSSFASSLLPIEPRSFVDPPLEGSARWVRPYKTVPPRRHTRQRVRSAPLRAFAHQLPLSRLNFDLDLHHAADPANARRVWSSRKPDLGPSQSNAVTLAVMVDCHLVLAFA